MYMGYEIIGKIDVPCHLQISWCYVVLYFSYFSPWKLVSCSVDLSSCHSYYVQIVLRSCWHVSGIYSYYVQIILRSCRHVPGIYGSTHILSIYAYYAPILTISNLNRHLSITYMLTRTLWICIRIWSVISDSVKKKKNELRYRTSNIHSYPTCFHPYLEIQSSLGSHLVGRSRITSSLWAAERAYRRWPISTSLPHASYS